MIGGALSSAVLGEALDGKGLLLNAAFAGLGGGIASGLGQMEGLGSLGEDMLNSGVHFGLDTGKAALMALDGDGNFDDTQFLADWGGSFAGALTDMASTFAGAVATGGIATKRRKLGAEKATIFSANSGAGLGDTKLVGDMSRAQSWNGGLLSYLARQAARGAALGRAQTLDGVAIGQMLGNGFYNIGMASAAYRKLDSSLDRAEEWAKRQGGADVGEIVDQQFYLESSIASGRYSGSTLKMLQDMRGQRLRFASRGSAVGADGETLARGFTAADGRRYLSTDQKGSLQQQLAGLVTRAHERERNGLKDGAWGQTVEGFRAVVTHAGMGSMLDGQFGSMYGRSWQSPLLRDEISSYRRGDMRALLGSTVNNYDHSSGDNFKLLDNGTSVNDGTLDLNKNGETIITAEELAEMSEEEYIKTLRSRGLITAEQAASGSLVRKQFQAMQAANRYHQQFGPEGFQGDPARQQALGSYMQGVDRIWQGDRASVDYIIASSQGRSIKELDPWQREAMRVKSGSWFGDPRSQWDFRGNGKARISAEDVQNLQNQDKLHNLLWTDFGRDSALTIGGTALTAGLFKGAGSLISRLRNTVQPRAPGGISDTSKSLFYNNRLPNNFITKDQAIKLGWKPNKGNLWDVAPGKSIGGDIFRNRPVGGIKPLPSAPKRIWYEADLNYQGGYRNSERVIYSSDGLIYYSGDHYQTFQMLGRR